MPLVKRTARWVKFDSGLAETVLSASGTPAWDYPDNGHLLTDTPGQRRAVGVETDSLDQEVSRFSLQHLRQRKPLISDPWVLLTVPEGYGIQFRHRNLHSRCTSGGLGRRLVHKH